MDPMLRPAEAEAALTSEVGSSATTVVRRRAGALARPVVLGELVVVLTLLVLYDRVRSLATVRSSDAVAHGWEILHTETVMHLRVEHALNSWLTDRTFLRLAATDYYEFMHVSVALAVLTGCYVLRPAVYRPARNALVVTNLVGLAVFALYPVAPPRLLPGAGFVDSVAAAGFGTNHGPIPADQYGAMPSLHLAWATWATLTVFAMTRRLAPRVLLVAHVGLTALVVAATANHYVLDVVSGTLLGVAAMGVTGLLAPAASGGLVANDLVGLATARLRAAVDLRPAPRTASRLSPAQEPSEP